MRLVVADTTPLNYLILVGQALAHIVRDGVRAGLVQGELRHPEAPDEVRQWAAAPPPWIEIVASGQDVDDPAFERLDDGERAAIGLAITIGADLILMDDRTGVAVARNKGFAVIGTLGVLDLAARRKLIRVDDAVERLRATSFRCRPEILDALLARHSA
jgi:predicted nucleic acid-binding protein